MAIDAKKVALNIGEDAAKSVVKELVLPLLEDLILKSENKYDDMLLPFKKQLEDLCLSAIDKIDGEKD
jgi:hypothetical protein